MISEKALKGVKPPKAGAQSRPGAGSKYLDSGHRRDEVR